MGLAEEGSGNMQSLYIYNGVVRNPNSRLGLADKEISGNEGPLVDPAHQMNPRIVTSSEFQPKSDGY